MTPAQIEGALVALAAIVVPGLLFWLWLMWLELRQTRELADYYCDKWEELGRITSELEAEVEQRWLADW